MAAFTYRLWTTRRLLAFNAGLLLHVISGISLVMGTALGITTLVSLGYEDAAHASFMGPGIPLLVGGLIGYVATRPPSAQVIIRPRDVYLSVTLAWVLAALLGAIPFVLQQNFLPVPAAIFEGMSGVTATGATIFDNVNDLVPSILLWRSILQWLGGIGIVVLFIGIAPALGASATKVMFAEVGGPAKERLTPRIAQTALLLFRVYLLLTTICFVAYRLAGMESFPAVNHAMTTIATGGMSTETASIAAFNNTSIHIVAMVFMFLGGVSFVLYANLLIGRPISRILSYEFFLYTGIILGIAAIITASLVLQGDVFSLPLALHDALFTTISFITTTGYTVADYDEWNHLARGILLFAMFIGGCASSTAGGIKVLRWMLIGSKLRDETNKLLHPQAVSRLKVAGKVFPETIQVGLLVFLFVYLIIFSFSTIAFTVMGVELESAIGASSASINLVGPAFGAFGASESYSAMPEPGMLLMALNMLLGRLEIFTVLVLMLPSFWRSR